MARSVAGYSSLQIALHWAVVVMITFQYVASRGMELAWNADLRSRRPPEDTIALANLHALAGVLILVLALGRLYLRFTRGAPPPLADEPRWQKMLSESVHWAIYALLLTLPISGAAAWIFEIEAAGGAHSLLTNILLGAIGLHVSGALFQHFVRRSDVMLRMLRPEPQGIERPTDRI